MFVYCHIACLFVIVKCLFICYCTVFVYNFVSVYCHCIVCLFVIVTFLFVCYCIVFVYNFVFV